MNLKTAVGEKHFDIPKNYVALVGANSFAHNLSFVRMNSHLQTQTLQLSFEDK